jgi:hypothetical protein
VEILFPVEFIVPGTPVSLQAKGPSKEIWKERVKSASTPTLPEGHWLTDEPIAVTLFYFPAEPMTGDLDNIIKLVLDALARHVYRGDRQIERILVQKFEPESIFEFAMPSQTLRKAMSSDKPLLYVRLSNDPFEELS